MTFKLLTQVKRNHVEILPDIMQFGFGIGLSLKPLMPEKLSLDITQQFEIPIVVERNGRYYAVANYLPLISARFSNSDSIYVIVIDPKPSLIKKMASDYILHLMSFQTSYDVFYPLFKEAVSLNIQCGHVKSFRNLRCSERALAELLNVDRQTIRTYVGRSHHS